MDDLISVIVPVYKVEEYIKRCIDSIINQTYKNLEIILVDDGSPDNCGKICDEYAKKDTRVKVIHKENGGLSDARNAGIKICKGKYISFIDSDDYVDEDYIEYLYNLIKKYNVKLSICGVNVVWKNKKCKQEKILKSECLDAKSALNNLLLHKGIEISAYAKMYLADLWKNFEFPKGKVYEDTAVIYKLIEEASTIAYGNKKCYYYIARKNSISKQNGFNKNEEDYIEHTKNMLADIKQMYPELEISIKRFELYANFRILRMLIFTNPRNKIMEKDIILKIKENQKEVFFYKEIPRRDKIAIVLLNIGLPVFKIFWYLYTKITGRN